MTPAMPMARFFRRLGRLRWERSVSYAGVFRAPFEGGWIECEHSSGERHVRGPMPSTPPHWIFRLLTQTGETVAEVSMFDTSSARVAALLEEIQRSARGEEGVEEPGARGEEGADGGRRWDSEWDSEYQDAWLRLWDWADHRGTSWEVPDLTGLSGPAARVLGRVREAVEQANAKRRATFVERQEGQEFMAARLLAWMAKAPEMQNGGCRKPAHIAFTAGPMRALAMAIEPLLTLHEAQYQDPGARLAGLLAQVEGDLALLALQGLFPAMAQVPDESCGAGSTPLSPLLHSSPTGNECEQGRATGEAPTGAGSIQRSAEVDTFEAERADRRGDWQRARDLYAWAGSSWAAACDDAEGSGLRSDFAVAAAVCWFRGGHFHETIAFVERVLTGPATLTEWVAHTLRELLRESRERLQP